MHGGVKNKHKKQKIGFVARVHRKGKDEARKTIESMNEPAKELKILHVSQSHQVLC